MKNILISHFILFLVLLCFQFIVIEVNACSVEEAAVTAAQAAYDEALEAVRAIEEEAARVSIRIMNPSIPVIPQRLHVTRDISQLKKEYCIIGKFKRTIKST